MVKKYGYDYSETLRDATSDKNLFSVMTKKEIVTYVILYFLMLFFLFIGIYSLLNINFYLGVFFIALEFPLGGSMSQEKQDQGLNSLLSELLIYSKHLLSSKLF